MARARNIKFGFFKNEELVELSFGTRLLFIGLWTLADREGRLEDRPKRIKMELFPADNLDVDEALCELEKSGFVIRYQANDARYIQVCNFKKHQNPHKDERPSTIPAPCEHRASTVQAPCKHDGNRADSLNPDSPIPESQKTPTAAVAAGEPQGFAECWAAYPKRAGGNSRRDALKAYHARLADDAPDVLLAGTLRYAAFIAATGRTGTEFVKQAATFYGPSKHYLEDWSPPPQQASPQTLTRDASRTLAAQTRLSDIYNDDGTLKNHGSSDFRTIEANTPGLLG